MRLSWQLFIRGIKKRTRLKVRWELFRVILANENSSEFYQSAFTFASASWLPVHHNKSRSLSFLPLVPESLVAGRRTGWISFTRSCGFRNKVQLPGNIFASRLVTWNFANPSRPGVNRSHRCQHEPSRDFRKVIHYYDALEGKGFGFACQSKGQWSRTSVALRVSR